MLYPILTTSNRDSQNCSPGAKFMSFMSVSRCNLHISGFHHRTILPMPDNMVLLDLEMKLFTSYSLSVSDCSNHVLQGGIWNASDTNNIQGTAKLSVFYFLEYLFMILLGLPSFGVIFASFNFLFLLFDKNKNGLWRKEDKPRLPRGVLSPILGEFIVKCTNPNKVALKQSYVT